VNRLLTGNRVQEKVASGAKGGVRVAEPVASNKVSRPPFCLLVIYLSMTHQHLIISYGKGNGRS